MAKVPHSLRTWFIIHFVVDILFGVPLLLFPNYIASLFGIGLVEPVTPRIVGAALLGIGGASFLAHKKGRETYEIMLNLKIIWSVTAIFALLISPPIIWPAVAIFALFSLVWMYYKRSIRN